MPGVYEGTCSHCGKDDFEIDWSLALYQDVDDRVVYLSHPNETEDIETHGVTMEQAQAQGRIVWSDTVICPACGAINTRQNLRPQVVHLSDRALQMMTLVAVGVGVLTRRVRLGILAGFAAFFAVYLVTRTVYRSRLRRAHRELVERRRERLNETLLCKACGGERLVPLGDCFRTEKLRCRACGERALSLDLTGIA